MKITFSEELPLELLDKNGRVYETVTTCADTGCTKSIFHPDMLPPCVRRRMKKSNTKIAGWKNKLTQAMGESTLRIAIYGYDNVTKEKKREEFELKILISEHLGPEPLISRDDLKRWKRVPFGFPHVILSDDQSENFMRERANVAKVSYQDRFWFDEPA